MAEEKKKKKDKGVFETMKEAYASAAKSGVLGARAKVQAEDSDKQADWFEGKKKKKN